MFLIILLVLSLLGNAALAYATWNMLRKQEMLENFVVNAMAAAQQTLSIARDLDSRQMFELDDDVGQIFKQLVTTVEDYAKFLGVESSTEQTNAPKA